MYCYPVIPSFVHFYGWNLPNVEGLYVRNGYGLQWTLKTIPVGLFNWASNIKYLQMYNVGLEALKCDVFQPLKNSLSFLNMHSNLFREFPSCVLKNLNQLERIYFSSQNIESANIDDLELNSLKYITLRQNKISNFSISNINNYNDIQILLDFNKISYLNISGVNRISHLQGKVNKISKINHGIFHSSHSNLVYLELSYNALDDDVWNVLEGVTSLKTLKLKQNKLHTVRPSVLNRLSALNELDLSHNYITSFADVLLRSGTMLNVLLNSNTLLNFPSNVIDDTNTFGSIYDCTIDISNNRLDNIKLLIFQQLVQNLH
ncbi:unnamed protein product [Mytilus edulis]|uniref:Uncharacterized protein n=1 Tax=Mytilus edulis TaxID=6550 RepID=A0A8S3VDJ4_MYTED|nr:unnamed protein product [Mytilus edulis]